MFYILTTTLSVVCLQEWMLKVNLMLVWFQVHMILEASGWYAKRKIRFFWHNTKNDKHSNEIQGYDKRECQHYEYMDM